jgi:catechol 2,3-dioxygenase-like lactoylglutathione lyase family enzyme
MAVQGVSIALSTQDVARSVKFYVEQLGLSPAF